MTSIYRMEFGYHPDLLALSSGPISISALPGIASAKADIESSDTLDQDWIYAPPQLVRNLGGGVHQRPYSARVIVWRCGVFLGLISVD